LFCCIFFEMVRLYLGQCYNETQNLRGVGVDAAGTRAEGGRLRCNLATIDSTRRVRLANRTYIVATLGAFGIGVALFPRSRFEVNTFQ